MAEANDRSLSQAFMRMHPAQAARVLESLPPGDAADLFERTPARVGAIVLAAMLPSWAARCLGPLDDSRALDLLSTMATQPAVAVLRHVAEPRRQALVAGLPTATALASTLLLGYGDSMLGAFADPDVVMLGADTPAAVALQRMRSDSTPHGLIFVADSERRLAGMVSLADLLRAPGDASLTTVMRPMAALLPAQASLVSARDNPGWAQASLLPVVEQGERLVGVLSHDALLRALLQASGGDGDEAAPAELPSLFALGYWQTLSSLWSWTLGLMPKVPAVLAVPEVAAAAGQRDER